MKQINLFFTVQVIRRKSGAYILKVPQRDDEWNYTWRKDTEGESPKNHISVCEIHYSKYQLIKSMYEITNYIITVQGYSQTKSF